MGKREEYISNCARRMAESKEPVLADPKKLEEIHYWSVMRTHDLESRQAQAIHELRFETYYG